MFLFSQGNGGSERLSGLPKFTQQVNSRHWIQTWVCSTLKPLLSSPCLYNIALVLTPCLGSWPSARTQYLGLWCYCLVSCFCFFFFFFSYFCWSIVDLQYCFSFSCTAKWFSYTYIYVHIYILFSIFFHYSLLEDIDYSSLCYTVNPCCLSILYMVVCIC